PTLPPFAFPSILSSCLVSLFVVRSVPPKSYPLPLHDALPISVSKMQTGPVSAVQDISASLGSAFGIMVLGSVSTAVFRSHLSSTAPDALSAAQSDAAADSPGAAAAIAGDLGGSAGGELLAGVHDGGTWAPVVVYAAAGLSGVLLMIVVGRGLRGIRPPSDEPAQHLDAEQAHPCP